MRVLIAVILFMLAGCATNKEYAAYLAGQQALQVQHTEAAKAKYAAIAKGMEGADASTRTAGMMALAFMSTPVINVSPPPESETLAFVKAIFPPLAYLGGIYVASDASKHAATMSRDVAVSTNSAFVGMGNNIQQAGTAGYPYVQAPQPNQTLSGTGVLGSGTYTSSQTTYTNSQNRNCNGGTAGIATPPEVPGAGGSANC